MKEQSAKKVVWTGPDRELPGIGLVHEGDTLELFAWAAESYIKQGLAREERQKPAKPNKDQQEDPEEPPPAEHDGEPGKED